MMDFNIITFHRSINFGAVLQAFALQEFITEQGYSAGIYDYIKPKANSGSLTFRGKISKVLNSFTRDERAENIQAERFESFRRDNLKLNLSTDSRAFLSGSDQVWNLYESFDSMFFLQFLNESVLKASYAASMAKPEIPKDKKRILTQFLNDFDMISVREEGIKDSLSKVTQKEISVNVDPTLLHNKEFYCSLARKADGIPEKYILAYILHIPKNGNRLLKWLKKETDLPVVLLDSTGKVGIVLNHNIVVRDAGPREFIYLFKNAQCVVTTSFHGVCFSIIFEKELYAIVNPNSPSRVSSLLKKVGIEAINEDDTSFSRHNLIDWNSVRRILNSERQKSADYIKGVYDAALKKKVSPLKGNVLLMNEQCTGCGACEAVCPVGAVKMTLNEKGFYEPTVIETKCIRCNKCLNMCPLNTKMTVWPDSAYYGWHNSPEVVFGSSSGGAFQAIADEIIRNSGVVFGAAYSDDWKDVVFECTDRVQLEKLRKSKYTVSAMSGVYAEIEEKLKNGRQVLFCGTPCQCAGIAKVFGSEYDNLITCDFICGGMASLAFYREHLEYLRKTYNSEIASVDFRPKDWGWGRYRLRVKFKNGKEYVKRNFADSYFECFINMSSVRRVCAGCPYYHFHRSDITIGDFWGYRALGIKKRKTGISLIICNNEKGRKIIDGLSGFEKHPMPVEFTQYTVRDKIPNENKLREKDRFFALASEKGFESAARELYDFNEMHYYIKRLRRILHI